MLVEESVRGWDEFELEVIRDRADNVVIVCSIENLDPMGVHTGDSVTVAPQMTLPDEAYQELRDAAIAVIRAVGVETGGSNIQFARNRETGELRVIEMNPRVSRSSALASKATGYPIAKVAAKLAVGYTLDEIPNDLTGDDARELRADARLRRRQGRRASRSRSSPAPTATLGTQMKSVGEAMGIGRTFAEAFLKAIRSRELDAGAVDAVADARRRCPRASTLVLPAELARSEALGPRDVESLVAGDWLRLQARSASPTPTIARALRTCRERGAARAGAPAASGPSYRRVDSCAGEVEAGVELLLLDLGRGGRGAARRPAARSSSSAPARTGSGRGSSSTTAASTPSRASASSATRP